MYADDSLITVSIGNYGDEGGAHGTYDVHYLSFDARDGSAIRFESIALTAAAKAGLHAALNTAAKTQLATSPTSTLADVGINVDVVPTIDNAGRLPGAWLFG